MSRHMRRIVIGSLSVLLFVALAMMSSVSLELAPVSATHISDVCAEHYHGSMTQDCSNVIGYTSSSWYGAGLTDMSEVVDEIWVRIIGIEVCNTLLPEFDWWEQNTNNDDWIVGISGSGDLSARCLPLGTIAQYSFHHATGANFHSGSIDRLHPNPWPQ